MDGSFWFCTNEYFFAFDFSFFFFFLYIYIHTHINIYFSVKDYSDGGVKGAAAHGA